VRLYEEEREASLRGAAARRLALIDALLAGASTPPAQAEAVLGRRLRGTHRALLAWAVDARALEDDEASAVRDAATALASDRPLLIAAAGGELTAWFTPAPGADPAAAQRCLAGAGLRGTLGEPGADLAGFVRTKRQADLARAVATPGAAVLTLYADVALASVLMRDPDVARDFALEQLGPLGAPTRPAATLRRTLAAYLACGQEQSRAAAMLSVHRNTVAAHVRQAEHQLGQPVIERAGELHAALLVWTITGTVAGRDALR
jgi:DNA-binding PucR family transcriptional regulator